MTVRMRAQNELSNKLRSGYSCAANCTEKHTFSMKIVKFSKKGHIKAHQLQVLLQNFARTALMLDYYPANLSTEQ